VPLPDQDRTRWNQTLIAEGVALLNRAVAQGSVREYQLQAAIAAAHDRAARAEETDWPRILALYGLLEQMTDNPVVTLNRAVATAMVDGPTAALAVLDEVADRLKDHRWVDSVRAHLLEMDGDAVGASAHYAAAARRTTSLPEQRYLLRQVARLTQAVPAPEE
jgi:predicted RNA polymerase sigma factor